MTDPTNRQRRLGLPRTPPPVGLESVRKAEIWSAALKSRTGGQPVLKSPFRGRKCELGQIGGSERDGALSLGDTSTADTPVALGRHNAWRGVGPAATCVRLRPYSLFVRWTMKEQ